MNWLQKLFATKGPHKHEFYETDVYAECLGILIDDDPDIKPKPAKCIHCYKTLDEIKAEEAKK